MRNQERRSDNTPSGRWGGAGQFHDEEPQHRYGRSSFINQENQSRGRNDWNRGNFRNDFREQERDSRANRPNYQTGGGYRNQDSLDEEYYYGGSSQSGGGGGFGSPSDYGDYNNPVTYTGGYYGSGGSYGAGPDYRNESGFGSGGNYSNEYGGAYNTNSMPGIDDSRQGILHGRSGYRSNYVAMEPEFDAVMEDPMTSSNYDPNNNPNRRSYRDYNTEDNYGSMQGRYSNYNNYTGRRDYADRGGSLHQDPEGDRFYNQRGQNQSWLGRAGDNLRSWFSGDQHQNDRW